MNNPLIISNPSYKKNSSIILYQGGKINNSKLLLSPSPKT
jgi:hypothetical protein